MKSEKPNSFVLIVASWLFMNVIYALITAEQFGRANDSGVALIWSGIYILISWTIFIWLPQLIFKNLKFGKLIILASPIMGIYAGLVYSIILGKIFQFGKTYFFFLPYAILTGFIYGFLLTISKRNRKTTRNLLYLIPIIGVFFYLVFPYAFPLQAFKFMPDKTQAKIVSRIVPKIKVGDSYKPYLTILPNSFRSIKGYSENSILPSIGDRKSDEYNSSISGSNEFISFNMKVEGGIITELNYDLKK